MTIYKTIAHLLRCGQDLVVAVIVSDLGSTPRATGSRMSIRGDGSIDGTIGGGILEAKVLEWSKEVFSRKTCLLKEFVLSAEDAGSIGMVCGGRTEILLHFLDASRPANKDLYERITTEIESRGRIRLITAIPSGEIGSEAPEQHLVRDDRVPIDAPDVGLFRACTEWAFTDKPRLISHGGRRFLVEPLVPAATVYIFGAGHISRSLAPMTRLVGFQTIVIDDREAFANRERFATADEIIVPDSFDKALDGFDINEDSYLVLVTRGHAHDRTILGQALRTRAGYIGMIGSRGKRDAIYDALREEGFAGEEFDRVRSPIGLDIGAETPEEIAVSIVAELILRRARKQ